jgi:hypothetical protein
MNNANKVQKVKHEGKFANSLFAITLTINLIGFAGSTL